jgi:hypothetical protein
MAADTTGISRAERDKIVIDAYTREWLSLAESASRAGTSPTTAARILARRGIPRRPPSVPGRKLPGRKPEVDEQALIRAYKRELLTVEQCARKFKIGRNTVLRVLDENFVRRRPPGIQPSPR